MPVECSSCHGTTPSTLNGGPHGMHSIGQSWVSGHQQYADSNSSQCQTCHGTDYKGTVLSRAQSTEVVNNRTFWAGQTIGCYECHNGRSGDGSAPAAPTVSNVSGTTTANNALVLTLPGSTNSLRIVSQPTNGVVALTNNVATYYPAVGFMGTETFTFCASSGFRDSVLATGAVTVVSGGCDFTVAPLSQAFDETGGMGTVTVTVPPCGGYNLPYGSSWNASSAVRWVTVMSGGGTNGSDTVNYRVARNTGPARTGTLIIAGQTLTVSQTAAVIQRPALAGIAGASPTIGLNGGGGKPNMLYYILSSSDLTVPAVNWARVGTNYFDADGNFLFSARVDASRAGAFFRVQQP